MYALLMYINGFTSTTDATLGFVTDKGCVGALRFNGNRSANMAYVEGGAVWQVCNDRVPPVLRFPKKGDPRGEGD